MVVHKHDWHTLALICSLSLCACARSEQMQAPERDGFSPGDSARNQASDGPAPGGAARPTQTTGGTTPATPGALPMPGTMQTPPMPGSQGGIAGTGSPPRDMAPLCDGSDAIWLGYTISGGFVEETYPFTDPFGSDFFFIDGHCDFYVRQGGPLVIGHLPDGVEQKLAERVQMQAVLETMHWMDYSCPDVGEERLRVVGHSLACTCGCDGDTPDWAEPAFAEAYQVLRELVSDGEPSTGALAVIGQLYGDIVDSELRSFAPWPLATSLRATPGLILDPLPGWGELSAGGLGVIFTGDDAAQLRALWDEHGGHVAVREEGEGFWLWLRDEPPPTVDKAIRAFLAGSD